MPVLNRPQDCTALVSYVHEYGLARPQRPFGPESGPPGPPIDQDIEEGFETSVSVTGIIQYENPSATRGDIITEIS